jgi:hypothetical protein
MRHIEPHIYQDNQYTRIGALVPWTILLDIHNAIRYGFTQYRLPEPGRTIDIKEAERHVAQIEREWRIEAEARDIKHEWTGAPPFSKLPTETKLYLHSVLRDAWQEYRSLVARCEF